MFKNHFARLIFILAFLLCGVASADETGVDTTAASGGNQIIVSPLNILLDLGESGYADALVLDKDGNPIEGHKLQIVAQDKAAVAIESDNPITNESGYIHFSILGKQQGETAVTVSDGAIASDINVAIRSLIHYVLPYFYGNMELSIINPAEGANYVKIQFHENSDRLIPPVMIRLEGKEMKTLKLSEQLNVTLMDGWAKITSTEIIFGGVWTNKGYLPFNPVKESY